MSYQLHFISAQPSDSYFAWQIELQLHNFRKHNYSQLYRILVFIPNDRISEGIPKEWKLLEEKYPEAKFFYYFDTEDVLNSVIRPINYIPYLRPYCLHKHFTEYPELSKDAFFYVDSDILFTRRLDFAPFLQDDICYLSDVSSYLNLEYWEGKIEESPKKESLRRINVVETLAKAFGITRQTIVDNNSGTGGAQSLLKGIDANYWADVMKGCVTVRLYYRDINTKFFASENAGYQSWCADMVSQLYNLWKRGIKTACPKELDFTWGTDDIKHLDIDYIYHNAGITSPVMELNGVKERVFYKGMYVNNDRIPYKERDYLESVSEKYACKFYANELLEMQNTIF